MHPIRWHCQKVLPLVYDDSLSYYEQVCKLVGKVNETIEELNDLQSKYTEILSYYQNIDSVIDGKINSKFVELRVTVERELNALDEKLSSQMEIVVNEVNTLTNLVNTFYDNSKSYTDSAIAGERTRVNAEIFRFEGRIEVELEELRKQIEDGMKLVKVYNPTTGFKDDIETILADIYDSARVNEGLTVAEYSGYGLSVSEYSGFNMSVTQYAMIAKKIINRFYQWFYNPFTGIKNTVENIASWCATEMLGTYTVNEYSALDLTVDGYALLDYTARGYLEANRGNREVLTLGGNGLTSSQYSQIGVTNL